MNTSSLFRFKTFLILSFCAVAMSVAPMMSFAGLLVTKSKEVQIGTLVESQNAVSLQGQYGGVNFPKENLLWYSTDKDIDTLFKAGTKAKSDGNLQAAGLLFELSISKESATQTQAQGELQLVKAKMAETVTSVAPAAPGNITDNLSPEEKIARGQQMIQNGKEIMGKEHMNADTAAAAKKTADQTIADGTKLVEQGQKELADRKAKEAAEAAKQAAEAAKRKEIEEQLNQAKQALEAIQHVSEWTQEEKMANGIAAIIFGVVVIASLWQITMKEAAD
ncbi:MAG: hypothetical protein HY360_00675 [Verrucomicrobia bacterium]|nr:hypothetical protein [Verrucomicrobiota bacterium]